MKFSLIKSLKRSFPFSLCLIVLIVSSFAEKTKIDGLFRYKLENGLELYVAENHSVPLAYIELAVRTGAIDQKKETAGLFHLYEHMMFKGNALYKDAASVTKALADLGVTEHNGTTSTDRVNYFFTIPSGKIEEGLAFWNAAIRSPLITEKEFENEKKVVLSEIQGDKANPTYVLHYYRNLLMFPDEPYKVDPRGSFDVVKNASVAQMRNIQDEFYIPENAAIFVGGDVYPDEIFELVKKIYGTWKNPVSKNTSPLEKNQPSKNPLAAKRFIVMPFDRMSPELAEVEITWRGPDLDFNYEDAQDSVYLDYILDKPDSILKTRLCEKPEFKIPDRTYIGSYTSLGRQNSTMGCYAVLKKPENNLASRAKEISEYIQNELYKETASDKKGFTSKIKKEFQASQEDSLIRASETAEGLITLARSCWINGEIEYFLNNKKEKSIKQKDIERFFDEYIASKNPVVTVLVNPAIYEKVKNEFIDLGFYEVKTDEELWWQKEQFAVDVKSFPVSSDYTADENIYIPQKNNGLEKELKSSRNVDVVTLKNGIKVYVQHTNSKMNALAIACMGGYEKYPAELSGLEGNLFDVMSCSSKNYSMEKRNQMEYVNGISIGKYCRSLGSVLYMYGMEKYFDEMLDVFTDGFLHPEFAPNVMENFFDGNEQSVQRILNSPESLLSWTIQKDVYKNHPYETTGGVTPDSVQNISVEKMKEAHEQIVKGGDFFIAASGTFNTKKLLKELNKTIGSIELDSSKKYTMKEIPALKLEKKKPVIISHPSAQGTAYCARVFASPDKDSSDKMAAYLAGDIYSDILYNVVREHYGICYTPFSRVITSKAPLSEDYLFKVSDYKNAGKAVKEAMDYMSRGITVEKCNEDGTYVFSTVGENLESYKSKWINSKYGTSASTKGQIFRIVSDLMYYDDMDYDLVETEEIKKLSADDIIRVFNKYWIENNAIWYAVTFPGNEKNLILE